MRKSKRCRDCGEIIAEVEVAYIGYNGDRFHDDKEICLRNLDAKTVRLTKETLDLTAEEEKLEREIEELEEKIAKAEAKCVSLKAEVAAYKQEQDSKETACTQQEH